MQFSQPVPTYVENFLAFPVGTLVPSGFYDRALGQWVASANGRVIKVLGSTGGFADLDIDGSNVAAGASALAALGVTDAERQRLAILYTAGQSLWRVPIQHFSPWDLNFPYGPPPDAKPPAGGGPPAPGPLPNKPPKGDPDNDCGSVIGCAQQTLGEAVNVTGTGVNLHYRSDRVPGRRDDSSVLRIRLSGAALPAGLQRIHLQVSVAGQLITKDFAPQVNLFDTFTWDGKDAYGRPTQGQQSLRVRIGYEYIAQYYATPDSLEASFNRFGSPPVAVGAGGGVVTFTRTPVRSTTPPLILWQDYEAATIGHLNSTGLGGWTLSVHHAYDIGGRTLYLGNGDRRNGIEASALIITTVAGTGIAGFAGDGGKATAAQLSGPQSVATGPDGSLYIADTYRVRKVAPNGTITTVAGNGQFAFSGDGGPATQAGFSFITGIALGPDGSLYIADFGNLRIRRVAPDGIVSTIAGNGTYAFAGDGGPATQAALQQPMNVAVGPDGSIYFSDSQTQRVRRVATDGIITTVAGTGVFNGPLGDGGPATLAALGFPEGIAVGADGVLYIADRGHVRVRRVGTDGIITTIAGNGLSSFTGDGGPAVLAGLSLVNDVALSPDGSVFISDFNNQRIRRVGPDGTITTTAGTGIFGYSGDGGPAAQGRINAPQGVAVRSDGSVYVADTDNNRIRLIRPVIPGIFIGGIAIASEDGAELYVFTDTGRHRRTLDALNGNVRFEFAYDSAGRLSTITDLDGNVITVTRDGSGNPAAITGPFGQQTTLTVNADGYLSNIANPAGQSTQLTYFTGGGAGLLKTLTDARGGVHQYLYDAVGRLTRDENPAGGVKVLARTEPGDNHYVVTVTTSSGLATLHDVEELSTGVTRRVRTESSGAVTETLLRPDGSRRVTYPDGAVANEVSGPDPRFGMQAPILKSQTLTTPGGKSQVVTRTQSVTLADENDLLSLLTRTSTLTIDGRTTTTDYVASTPALSIQSPAGRTGSVSLNARGLITQAQVTGLSPMIFGYTAKGRVGTVTEGTAGTARTTTLTYGSAGPSAAWLARIDDALGRQTSITYDAAGRATQQTLPGGGVVGYGYDANAGITSLTPPGRPAHTFTWTNDQQLASYTPPTVPGGGASISYGYDADRRLAQVIQPDGQAVAVTYDATGRPIQLTQPGRNIGVTYQGTTSNIQTISGPVGQQLTYGGDGPVLISQTWSGPIAGSVSRTLDNGLRTATSSVNAAAISLTYDLDSLLTGAGALALTRHPSHGLVSGTTLGGVTDTRTYTGFGALDHYTASYTGTAFYDVQYTRDALGRITTRSETISGITDNYTYGYDTAGRLTLVQKNGGTTHTHTYDVNGNRLTANAVASTFDGQDRQTAAGTTAFVHTLNGERQTKTAVSGTTTYAYDAIGNLLNVSLPGALQVAFLLDGVSRRVGKKVGGTLVQGWLYDERSRIVAELDGTGAVLSRFVYASRASTPDYMVRGGVNYRLVSDHLGSVRFVVNSANGAIAQRLDYDPFGSVTSDTAPGFQPFGFAGGLYDTDTKLIRYGARDYDPETGRWTTKDPIFFAGGDTNLYAYATNDPVNRHDSNGLDGPGDGGVCLGPPPDLNLGKPLFLDRTPNAPLPPLCPTCSIPAAPKGASGGGGGGGGLTFGPFNFSGQLNFPSIGDLRDWNPRSLFDKFGLKLDAPLNPDFTLPDSRKDPGSPDPNGPKPRPQAPQCSREPSHDPGFTSCQ
ncbi:MAG: RHS repeat-associated core domain-containing protein [Betaproteobacteria bacterium]